MGKWILRKRARALANAAFSMPPVTSFAVPVAALAAALFPSGWASAQVTGQVSGSITADYSSGTDSQGDTVYGFSDASANLTLTIPIVPVSAATSTSAESWSAPATWGGAPILFSNNGVVITGNNAQQAGAYLVVPASANTLTQDGPTQQPVIFYNFNLESTGVPGVNASFTLSNVMSYDATIPTGANVNMDQQAVVVDSLAIANGGTLAGDGNFTVVTSLNNCGALNNLAGTVEGNFTNGQTGTADITGALYLQGSFSNQGAVTLEQNGSINFSLPATNNGQFNFNGGVINTVGPLVNNGQFNWYVGALPNFTNSFTGTVSLIGSGSMYLPPNGTLINSGTILQIGTATFAIDGNYNYAVNQASIATVTNLPGAVYNLQGDGEIANQTSGYPYYGDSVFNNAGKFEKTDGAGTSDVGGGIAFNNTGTVEVDTGTIQFDGGGSSTTATYIFKNNGQIIIDSPFTVIGLNTSSGSGAMTISNGGALLGTGTLSFAPGNLVLSDQSTIGNGLTNAANLQVFATNYDAVVTGTFTNVGTIQHTQGTFQINPDSTLNNYGTIQQIGSNTTFSVDGNYNYAINQASPSIANNFAGAVYDLIGDGQLTNPTSGYPLNPDAPFNNYGLFEKTAGTGVSAVGGGIAFNNSGAISVFSGTLEFDGGVTNTGSITIAPAARITFNGALTSSVPITNQGWLYINGGGSTSGKITGNGGLVIGLLGNPTTLQLAIGSGTTQLSALAINPNSTLDITNNTIAINFGAPANDPISTISGYLANGYNGGTWTGTEINSSVAAAGITPLLAVGYADGNTDHGTPATANQIVIKYTLAGDANLDGKVDFTDLGIVGQHLNTTGNDWAHGNFTYDPNGAVTFTDLGIVGQNLNKLLTPAGSSGELYPGGGQVLASAAQLPEPTGMFILFGASAAILSRCKRGQNINRN